ncbi:MAG TPA: DUF402 domain-containing protein [Kribbella sp.]
MTFSAGQTILRRYWTGDRITVLNSLRVVADDTDGLRLWLPAGTPYWRVLTADGRTQHEAPFEIAGESAALAQFRWQGSDVLIWVPPAEVAYSVWWFWDARSGEFQGWYGNLEAAAVRWSDQAASGFDTVDHALDLWVAPDGSCSWKDLDEFEHRTGHPLYWNAVQAATIRGTGDQLMEIARAGKFPFDGTWTDFRPDPSWPDPAWPDPAWLESVRPESVRPEHGWDRPRADPGGVAGS